MTRIISIDPSFDGVTGIIVAEVDQFDNIELIDFANLDFRFEETDDLNLKNEFRLRQIDKLCKWIYNLKPDLVICENFIMFAQQMGRFGQAFYTSEMIGIITFFLQRKKIPIIKPRSSDVRGAHQGYYPSGQPRPKPFKDGLTNQDLKEKGFLVHRGNKGNYLVVGDNEYKLSDFKVGAKNDHIYMALRHLVNTVENKNIYEIIDNAHEVYNAKRKTGRKRKTR